MCIKVINIDKYLVGISFGINAVLCMQYIRKKHT